MPAAQRPTTLNSMTHYATTEDQMEVMEASMEDEEGKESEQKLLEALQSTPNDTSDTRVKSAIQAGLLVPELLPSRLEQEQKRRDEDQENWRRQQEQNQPQDQQQEEYTEEANH